MSGVWSSLDNDTGPRDCTRCGKPVEPERYRLVHSRICSLCAHKIEENLSKINHGPLKKRAPAGVMVRRFEQLELSSSSTGTMALSSGYQSQCEKWKAKYHPVLAPKLPKSLKKFLVTRIYDDDEVV